jgi:hypothetical protein
MSSEEVRARLDEIQRAIPHACALCMQGWTPSYQAVGFDLGWWHGHVARCGAHALRNRAAQLAESIAQATRLN